MSAAYAEGLKLSSQGRHVEAIARFEQALAVRPDDARVLFALGNTAHVLGLTGPAEQFFRQVLTLEPGRKEALVNLANLLRASGQFDAAIALLEPALAREPGAVEFHLTIGSAWREKGEDARAIRHYRAALETDPNYAPALANLADMLCDAGDRAAARTLYDRAIKTDPKNPQARLNRAILHLLNGDLKDGWRDYAARTDVPNKVPVMSGEQPHLPLKLMPWTGDSLKKKRLLVRAEQGVGDQILFASLIPDLAARAKTEAGSVVLECEPRLASLFARSFPDVTVRAATIRTVGPTPVADYGWLKAAGGASAAVLMGNLPRYLRGTLDAFPTPHAFLTPGADEVARWKNVFAPEAIGICWRSGKSGGHRSIQYAPLEAWGEFLRQTDRTFVCVQYDAAAEEIAELERISGRKIIVPQGIDQKNELDRAAALLAALDMVITAPTAVSWLAAGVGTHTLKALYDTSWTALGQTYEPFAPACECVMPATRGDWRDVFAQVKAKI
ncbi:MAG TPA: tetratricopeptide repeat protein [Rhizomicrobium sp.]|nr:tetratricopeptide repeat protein [Rhizomicrobium sp.]